MSDPIATQEVQFDYFCPDCPERKDLTDNADIRYCGYHRPSESGEADHQANPLHEQYCPSLQEGVNDVGICDFIHRGVIGKNV